MLENISIVLVEPQGGLNVGMTARAMKNCGMSKLKLVNPAKFKERELYMLACNSGEIIDNAKTFKTLKEALADESCSAAFTRRTGHARAPYYYLDDISKELLERTRRGSVALVFGREDDGLTNEEIFECDFRVTIPSSEKNPSFNLGQAVLLACYTLFKDSKECRKLPLEFFATNELLDPMYEDFKKFLLEIGYTGRNDTKLRKKIFQAHKEIFGRAGLRRKDVNMFLGIYSQVRKAIGLKK